MDENDNHIYTKRFNLPFFPLSFIAVFDIEHKNHGKYL